MFGQVNLRCDGIDIIQIIKSKITRNSWLIVTTETRGAPRYVSPLCKSATPPFVVLFEGIKLRQIESDGFDPRGYITAIQCISWLKSRPWVGEKADVVSQRLRSLDGTARYTMRQGFCFAVIRAPGNTRTFAQKP